MYACTQVKDESAITTANSMLRGGISKGKSWRSYLCVCMLRSAAEEDLPRAAAVLDGMGTNLGNGGSPKAAICSGMSYCCRAAVEEVGVCDGERSSGGICLVSAQIPSS